MAVCPWCKAEVRDSNAPCPRCGKHAAEDVPDLIIPTRHVSPKAPPKPGATAANALKPAPVISPGAAPRAGVASNQVGGSSNVFDDEDAFGDPNAASALDLDLSHGPPMPIAAPGAPRGLAASSGAIDRVSMGKMGAASSGTMASQPPPSSGGNSGVGNSGSAKNVQNARTSGAPPNAAPEAFAIAVPEIDPFEARALADYGPPPANWWMTPLYAYRVKKRLPELKRSLVTKREEAERAETAAEDALMTFAGRVRPAAQSNPRYAETLQDVVQTEELFRTRDTALAGEMDAHKQRQAQLEAGIVELEAQIAAVQAEERVIQGELAEADALLKRADARVKRADIEIRNAMTQLEPKAPAGAVTK